MVRHRGDGTLDDIETAGKCKKGELTGVPTGCTDLDDLTLGLGIARAASLKHQLTSGLFSLWMSCEELHMRLLSVEGPVALTASAPGLRRRRPGPAWPRPKPGSTPATCSCRLKQRGHRGPVVIDYLQLLQYAAAAAPSPAGRRSPASPASSS